MPQKSDLLQPKLALAELCIKLMVPQGLQGDPEMLLVLCLCPRKDENVVDEYYDELIQERAKNPVH